MMYVSAGWRASPFGPKSSDVIRHRYWNDTPAVQANAQPTVSEHNMPMSWSQVKGVTQRLRTARALTSGARRYWEQTISRYWKPLLEAAIGGKLCKRLLQQLLLRQRVAVTLSAARGLDQRSAAT